MLTNHNSAFWNNQTARIWSPHLHEGRSVRDKGWGLPAWRVPFPFPWRLNSVCICLADLKHGRCLPRAEWSRPARCRAELSRQRGAGGGAASKTSKTSKTRCFHSRSASLLSCFALNKVCFFYTPQIGNPCWHWIATQDSWPPADNTKASILVKREEFCRQGSILYLIRRKKV